MNPQERIDVALSLIDHQLKHPSDSNILSAVKSILSGETSTDLSSRTQPSPAKDKRAVDWSQLSSLVYLFNHVEVVSSACGSQSSAMKKALEKEIIRLCLDSDTLASLLPVYISGSRTSFER